MRWQGGRRSTNIEDRRGSRVGLVGGGLGGLVLLLVAMFFGVDPGMLVNETDTDVDASGPGPSSPADDAAKDFVSAVVGYTEDTWSKLFRAAGSTYRPPKLVLFTGAVRSACGFAQAAMGPFYCPADEKVYIDMSFFQDLRDRFSAPGDFAQAYVIAHEVGHHVQNLTGISEQVQATQQRSGKAEGNRASVRLELQADCFAGLWAHHTEKSEQSQLREFLETGDVEEALRAASAIGDDRLQMQTRGYVVPESFTHGTAEQRARWFRTGLEQGSIASCDTFKASE
jgi:predicted metalloprotease